jgi:hypothetical protein
VISDNAATAGSSAEFPKLIFLAIFCKNVTAENKAYNAIRLMMTKSTFFTQK